MIKKLRVKTLSVFLSFLLICSLQAAKAQNNAETLHQLNSLLINTVMVDFFTPPVASRVYSYPNIAFYECVRQEDPSLPDLMGKLNGTDANMIPAIDKNIKIDNLIAAAIAFSYTAQALVGTEKNFEDWRQHFIDSLLFKGGNADFIKNSILYGKSVSDNIVAWAKKDNYNQSRAMPRFTNSDQPGTWQPTPADYAPAIEPHWNTMRPFTLKSADQCSPKDKLLYSRNKSSVFYKTMMEVYTIGKKLDTTQKLIAHYWDDNPNVSTNLGHLNYFIHKISAGGHWLMIAKQACQQKNVPAAKASLIYTLASIAIYDGFISAWSEKFISNLVRPITVINDFVDKKWEPYIQTPPFPEFTSAHGVISNAAATVLTGILGDNFEFTDQAEIPFGNDARHFNSFNEAAKEVTWSRVYGGIHYPETARISIIQGKDIGNNVLETLYPKALK